MEQAKQVLCCWMIVSFFMLPGGFVIAQTPDPGVMGSYTVVSDFYDLGEEAFSPNNFPGDVEVRGTVHYPSDLSAAPFPMLLFLHGRHVTCYQTSNNNTSLRWPCYSYEEEIPNYNGYEYLAELMASHGYIVVSIGANGISAADNNTGDYGMIARAELIQYHLDLWNNFNSSGGAPFGNLFVGALDMTNIGTMGHSRGGEGVITHGVYNQDHGSPYGINAVLTLGPTNYTRPVLINTAIGAVLPYCDGDEPNLGGLHYYDDARYLDPDDESPKHTILMMGGNHNYFNTVWTPGLFPAGTVDDWQYIDYFNNDPFCGENAPDNHRFDPPTQRAALIAYASAFFRTYIGQESQFAPILEVDDLNPPASSTLSAEQVYVSYHAPGSKRLDINRTDNESTEVTNTLSGNVLQNGLVNLDICGDDMGELFCLNEEEIQEPHNHYHGSAKLGLSQLQLEWNSTDDWYENELPAAYSDFTTYSALQFRASVDFKNSPQDQSLNFNVQLRDGTGNTHTEQVSNHSHAMFYSPGTLNGYLPRVVHNTIKMKLSYFTGVDLTDIEAIRFMFDESNTGAIIISDIALSMPTDSTWVTIDETNADNHNQIILYPNPAVKYLNVSGVDLNHGYHIVNTLGQVVLSGRDSVINISEMPKGMYILKTNTAKAKFIVR